MDEIQRTIGINPELEAYQGFFDYEWKARFLETVRHSKLREPGYDLTRNWEAISNARQLPWIMVQCLDTVSCEKLHQFVPWDQRKIRIVRQKLLAKLEASGENLRPMFRKRLTQALKELDEEAEHVRDDAANCTLENRESFWEGLIDIPAFHTSLWALERMGYGSLYYSYECFVMRCLSIAQNDASYRLPRGKEINKHLRKAFGDKITEDCWLDQAIDLARVTRHALVHNGGRVTPDVQNRKHTFRIEDGEIQINAIHTTQLYERLKDRVTQLAESATLLPEFTETT